MMNFRLAFSAFILLISICTSAQTKVSGKITDAKTKKPVAYADVTLPNAGVFVTTNTDGSLYLESEISDSIIEVSADGFEFFEQKLDSKVNYDFNIELQSDSSLNE